MRLLLLVTWRQEWLWRVLFSFWFTLSPSGMQKSRSWWLSRVPLSRASPHCDAVCAVRTWKCGAFFPPHPRIWESLLLCLGVACGVQDSGFFGRCCVCVIHAQCRARQWIHLLHQCLVAFGRIAHIFKVEVDSDPEVSCLHFVAEWRSVLSRCFSLQFTLRCSHL